MNNKIFVGNLGFSVVDETLSAAFAQYGTVTSAKVIMDRDTNRSKGFGFVEMSSASEAEEAISALNGTELEGRAMNVSEAKPQAPRNDRVFSDRGGDRGGGGGGNRRGGGGGRY